MRRWISPGFLLLLAIVAGGLASLFGSREGGPMRATLAVADALRAADTSGFARADEPREFVFPDDHGPHPEFKTEWWYLTGNLDAESGRRFGFQLTLFRTALVPDAPAIESEWATNQVYMGHFTVTDVDGGAFHDFERFARGAVGLAGARVRPFRVWLEDWVIEAASNASGDQGGIPGGEEGGPEGEEDAPSGEEGAPKGAKGAPSLDEGAAGGDEGASQGDIPPFRVVAGEGDVGLRLDVEPGKPLILQGDAGLSRKAPGAGNASYYYSFTRLPASGEIRVGGARFRVEGLVWMDREWSTSVLGEAETGWDWFALQLSDGRDIMFGRTRRADGTDGAFREGALVEADGSYRILGGDEVVLEVRDRWTSPVHGAHYPARWRLAVPAEGIDLDVRPLLADQELDVTFRYWEGAVEVAGTSGEESVTGRGYAELTGYAGVGSPR